MKTHFATSQIARVVRLVSPMFNVRVNRAGNLAIEPSAVTGATLAKFLLYKTKDGYVLWRGNVEDIQQKHYSRVCHPIYGCKALPFNDVIHNLSYTLRSEGFIR